MDPIIQMRSVSFSYPGTQRKVLDNCSLSVEAGEIISILGPNGAGKSTLLNCACNLLAPQSGDVLLNGKPIRTLAARDVARVIGYVQQYQKSAFSYTVFDYVLMGRASRVGMFKKPSEADRAAAWEALEKMGVRHLAERPITEISGGERQQAAIARAIAQEPQVIFFDEPTAHLDYGNQIATLRLIASLRRDGFAALMTTHNPDHCIMLGGKIALLDKDGHLEIGDVSQIADAKVLSKVYHTDLLGPYIEEAGRFACVPKSI